MNDTLGEMLKEADIITFVYCPRNYLERRSKTLTDFFHDSLLEDK
jgi:hypothetical protein